MKNICSDFFVSLVPIICLAFKEIYVPIFHDQCMEAQSWAKKDCNEIVTLLNCTYNRLYINWKLERKYWPEKCMLLYICEN